MDQPKPERHLIGAVTGKAEEDLRVVLGLYEKLTGEKSTPEEAAEAAAELAARGKADPLSD